MSDRLISPNYYRRILGRFPTGVVIVTATGEDRTPIGMVVGSFTSVSLEPPLVAYLPARTSSSYAQLRRRDRFCVNVLADSQEQVCRAFATRKGADKFEGVAWSSDSGGSPRLHDAAAWLECRLTREIDAGDHYIVVGEVEAAESSAAGQPLVFYEGGYGGFSPRSRVIGSTPRLADVIVEVDRIRSRLQGLADRLDLDLGVMAPDGNDVVRVASASGASGPLAAIRVGQRMPLRAPLGALLVAWEEPDVRARWIASGVAGDLEESKAAHERALAAVREHGWLATQMSEAYTALDEVLRGRPVITSSNDPIGEHEARLGGADAYDPRRIRPGGRYLLRTLAVPVADSRGCVRLYCGVYGFRSQLSGRSIASLAEQVAYALNPERGFRTPDIDDGPGCAPVA